MHKKVARIEANANKVHFADGGSIDYDILCVNVGSKTRDTERVPGVWEYSLPTRPINNLLERISKKEQDMTAKGIIPRVAVVGSGAAGVEMAFAFKQRWGAFFG